MVINKNLLKNSGYKLLKALKICTLSKYESHAKWDIVKYFFFSLFTITEFDKRNTIFFQIKVFGRKIKETMPARYLIKVMRALVLRDWQSLDE